MNSNRLSIAIFALLCFPIACSSCATAIRGTMEIKTNGFLTPNIYQAILEIEPDDSANGLVEKRESAYLKGKESVLNKMALENLVAYCIDSRLKAGMLDSVKMHVDHERHKADLMNALKGFTRGGNIAFIYYSEKNSMIIGYRMFSIGFRNKLNAIINTPVESRQENPVPDARS
ncbi:MAG: hypothetical protein A2176_10930 [Spirochaetes bacterium RBG_13_51_14]|nr:MAG: hypothetical protein A2176_10930 [Spirochaetes bacterium RBG_13_51_14]